MKGRPFATASAITVGIWLLAASVVAGPAAASEGPRLALVIGNGAYRDAPLRNPVSDARLIAAILRQVGFDVDERLDLDQKGMKRAIRDLGARLEKAGPETVGLFYYSGHGVQVGGHNYLLPVTADIRRESDVDIEGVTADTVLSIFAFARNRLNFVILDACRNNPFARSFRSATTGLARMDAPRGTLIAYATAPGKVAADGSGANSPYSAALAEAMRRTDLPVEQMFKEVRRRVMAATGEQQVPWEASSLTGDFFFSVERTAAAAPAPAAASPAPAAVAGAATPAEIVFWQSIEASEDPAVFRAYLEQYPGGAFASLARIRLASLEASAARPAETAPPAPTQSQAKAIVRSYTGRWTIDDGTFAGHIDIDGRKVSGVLHESRADGITTGGISGELSSAGELSAWWSGGFRDSRKITGRLPELNVWGSDKPLRFRREE